MSRHPSIPLVLMICLPSWTTVAAHDWPQHLGPTRNGVYSDADVAASWPSSGPRTVWRFDCGEGFSAPVVAGDRVILFHRVDGREVIDCLQAAGGEKVWTSSYPTAYRDDFGFDDGPRATPTVAAGRVFTFGAEGVLRCTALDSGAEVWKVATQERFGVEKAFFGAACSPLVVGEMVLVNVGGGDGAGIVAFGVEKGDVRWKATDDEASYSSPVAATIDGRRHAFFFTRHGFVDLDPLDGKVRARERWRARIAASVNAATPLVLGSHVFLSTSYSTGAILFEVSDSGAKKVWAGDGVLSNHYATSVPHGEFLYGFDGRQERPCRLRCIEWKTGKVRWSKERFGYGSITRVKDRLLILLDGGELISAAADADDFEPRARAQILPRTVRAYPALANGLLYARNEKTLVCVDLRAP